MFIIDAILECTRLKVLILRTGDVMLSPRDIVTDPLSLELWLPLGHFGLLALLNQQRKELPY